MREIVVENTLEVGRSLSSRVFTVTFNHLHTSEESLRATSEVFSISSAVFDNAVRRCGMDDRIDAIDGTRLLRHAIGMGEGLA